MNRALRELVVYRIERARETLEDALLLARQERWPSSANRLYYACFYSVSALLLSEGLSSTKHSGVRSLFNRHFVKTGRVNKAHGRLFNDLYELRQESDYVDLLRIDSEPVLPCLEPAGQLVDALATLALAPESSTDED